MKVYLQPPQHSLGLERIATALRKYAPPSVTIHTFPNLSNNDLTVIYAIGRRDSIERQCEKILKAGKRYAIIQICLRSTMAPDCHDWLEIWNRAEVVWSYYDLNLAIEMDALAGKMSAYLPISNFYHAPLGADAKVFYPRGFDKDFIIGTSGTSRLSESVRECALAAEVVDRRLFHLGPQLRLNGRTLCLSGMNDSVLATYYSHCQFVSGLRRTEGFELPAVEGLLCGARPICFDTLDYRWNYQNFADYIKEGTRQEVVDQLVELFKRGARPVTAEEREQAVERFSWEKIIGGFYEHLK